MKNLLSRYLIKPAKWWQFWLPQSGIFGGIIAGVIINLILLLLGIHILQVLR